MGVNPRRQIRGAREVVFCTQTGVFKWFLTFVRYWSANSRIAKDAAFAGAAS